MVYKNKNYLSLTNITHTFSKPCVRFSTFNGFSCLDIASRWCRAACAHVVGHNSSDHGHKPRHQFRNAGRTLHPELPHHAFRFRAGYVVIMYFHKWIGGYKEPHGLFLMITDSMAQSTGASVYKAADYSSTD